MKQWEKFVKRCDFTLRDAAQTYTREARASIDSAEEVLKAQHAIHLRAGVKACHRT
ncbi:hypothetical protein GHT06_009732 [Daphnia sinensis]|uniref:Uncharacterized protein n=1 Tax=Daphnia sinensis TaxID=1820382 RepID=A0AAD5Q3E8_9CRUS|nr:hypothetical protein GHT06_009732 [Daphnia sinensis]